MKKRTRKPLSRDAVLRAALDLADKTGIEALSMRKLASKLGVEAMSLYKHVANKEEVLDGVVDLIVAQIKIEPVSAGWRPALRARAVSTRAVLHEHPWALMLMQDIKPTPERLKYQDAVLGLMREHGFSLKNAYRAFLLMDSYIYGFLMQELSWNADDPNAVDDMQLRTVSERYPYFSEALGHVTALVAKSGAKAAYDVEFNFGLDLILDTLARMARPVS